MWEISYTIEPDGGYFDRAEQILYDNDVVLRTIRSIEFLSDGSVVIVYEIDGSLPTLQRCLSDGSGKVLAYSTTETDGLIVAQIRFVPDEPLGQLFTIHRTFGVTVEFPLHYVGHDPFRIELVEVGPHTELTDRIQQTRTIASVTINHSYRYDPSSRRYLGVLTQRQEEILAAAIHAGYYQIPRETTHEELATQLDCSASMVGQHLQRIEHRLIGTLFQGHDPTSVPS